MSEEVTRESLRVENTERLRKELQAEHVANVMGRVRQATSAYTGEETAIAVDTSNHRLYLVQAGGNIIWRPTQSGAAPGEPMPSTIEEVIELLLWEDLPIYPARQALQNMGAYTEAGVELLFHESLLEEALEELYRAHGL